MQVCKTVDDEGLELTQTSIATPGRSLSSLELGASIGRYVVVGTLGVGGMGVVHSAYDPELDRKLAIKLLRGVETGSRQRLEIHTRLLREAQAIARLNHPNVVAVHDVGLHHGQVFVAMEFVDGGDLGSWIKSVEEPRSWHEVLGVFRAAGKGLAAAHAAGLVHRDFKPANILLGRDGRPRVADFGIARSVEGGDTQELDLLPEFAESTGSQLNDLLVTSGTLTRTGVLVGTPAYMAPEQFRNAQVDARADQFAFCVALYEALYGHRPFRAETLAELIEMITLGHVREEARGSGVPKWLRKIVLRGLEKQPADRWPDMNSLLQALERRPRRRGQMIAALSSSVAALAAVAAITLGGTSADTPVCTEGANALAQTWSPTRRASMSEHLAELSHAGDRSEHVLTRLDRWADDWRAGWLDACEATHVRAEQSPELLDRRMSCLQRGRQRMDAYLALLGATDTALTPGVLDGLDTLVEELGDPKRCANIERLMSAVAVPELPEQRARVEGLTARLDPVYASLAAGEWARAQAELAPLETAIAAESWLPLAAELAYVQGKLEAGRSALEPAETAYRIAFLSALEVGDEQLAAKAHRDLAQLIAEWDSRHDEALELLRRAEAHARHLGDAELEGSVSLVRATTLELRGDFEPALEAVRHGATLTAQTHGPHSTVLAHARYRESMTLYRLGRLDEALVALDQGQASMGSTYGQTHPVALELLNARGVLALGSADWALAERHFAELLARKQAMFGPDHLDVSDALSNLGAAQYNAGKLEAARHSHTHALAIREREMGADNLYTGHSLANLATLYARLGRHTEAGAAALRAFEIIAAVRGARHHDTMIAHSLVAEVAQLAGDEHAALAAFTDALNIATELELPAQEIELGLQVALARFHLGHFDAANTQLDAADARVETALTPTQLLLREYLRARIAMEHGDPQTAAPHIAWARAQVPLVDGLGASDEAHAWLALQD